MNGVKQKLVIPIDIIFHYKLLRNKSKNWNSHTYLSSTLYHLFFQIYNFFSLFVYN